jgi:hypothetical protein
MADWSLLAVSNRVNLRATCSDTDQLAPDSTARGENVRHCSAESATVSITGGPSGGTVRPRARPGPVQRRAESSDVHPQHLADVQCEIDVTIVAYTFAAERQKVGNHFRRDRLAGSRLSRTPAARFHRPGPLQARVDGLKQLSRAVFEVRVVVPARKHLAIRRDDPDSLILIFLTLDRMKQFAAAVVGLAHRTG